MKIEWFSREWQIRENFRNREKVIWFGVLIVCSPTEGRTTALGNWVWEFVESIKLSEMGGERQGPRAAWV
jgi:hypothetical protein